MLGLKRVEKYEKRTRKLCKNVHIMMDILIPAIEEMVVQVSQGSLNACCAFLVSPSYFKKIMKVKYRGQNTRNNMMKLNIGEIKLRQFLQV